MAQRRNLEGLRMLITGASQGIGRALAELAAQRGVKVLAAARTDALLQELAEQIKAKGHTIETVQADVTNPDDRQNMADTAKEKFGGLDVLVNNAGIGATGHFAEASEERLRKLFEVNFFGTTETTRVCLPLLREGHHAAIINISSVAGLRGIPGRSEYSASKFAIRGFSEALRAEMARFDIDVFVVNPGLTDTNFSKNMLEQKARYQVDHMRGMTAEQVAEATLRALAIGKGDITLTRQAKLIAFVNRFFPRLADRFAMNKVRELFKEEIDARHAGQATPEPAESKS